MKDIFTILENLRIEVAGFGGKVRGQHCKNTSGKMKRPNPLVVRKTLVAKLQLGLALRFSLNMSRKTYYSRSVRCILVDPLGLCTSSSQ